MDVLDSLVVHLGTLNVGRHGRSQIAELRDICGHTNVETLGVVI